MTDPTAPDPVAPRRRRRVLKYVLGGVALLLVGGVVVASLRFDSIVNNLKDRQLAALSKTLGRPVKVGKVTTHLLSLSLDVADVSVAPDPKRPAETLPVLALRRLHVGLAGRTVWSLGKRPGLTALEIEGLTVNVVKHPDGTLNVLNLIDALPQEEEPSPPMDAETKALVRQLSIERLRLGDTRLHFVDLSRGGAVVDVGQIELAADGVALDRPSAFSFGAALLSSRKNLSLAARLGAAPPSLEGGPPLEHLKAKLERTDLAPLASFLSAALPAALGGLEAATLALDAELGRPAANGPALWKSDLAVTGVRFGAGQPFDLTLASDVSATPGPRGGATVDIRRLALGLAAMTIEAQGRIEAQDTPRFSGFQLQSKGLDFDRLRQLLPDLDQRAGAVLHGPFSLSAKAGGSAAAQQFEAILDLSAAAITVPAVLAKPAGVPLRLEARGKAENDGVELEDLGLQVADWRLAARGTARGLSRPAPALDFTAEAKAPGLGGLLRLLPPVAAALGGRARTDGQLAVKARLAGTPVNLHAEADVQLSRLAVSVPDTRLGGGGTIKLVADRKERSLDATVKVDFTPLEAFYLDVIRKRAGVPLALEAVVAQAGGAQNVRVTLRAAELRAEGKATLTAAGKDQALAGELAVPPFRTGSLTAMLPGLVDTPLADMRAGARVQVRGRLGEPASMKITVEDLSLAAGKSDLQGRLTVVNLERPRVDLEAKSSYLDLDDFLPKGGSRTAGAPPPPPAQKQPPPDVTGRARLEVARGRAAGIDYQGLRTDLNLTGGRAVARTLDVSVFGGDFSGAGTQLSPFDDRQPFVAKGLLRRIDTDAVIQHFLGVRGLLVGRLDSTVELGGAGTELDLLEKTLEGFLDGGVKEAQLLGDDFFPSLLAPIVARVDALTGADKLLDLASPALRKLSDRALSEVRTGMKIAKGAINLSRPVTFETARGPLKLDGRVLIGGRWDMAGVLSLSPEAATALTGGRLKIDRPVPIKLAITGPLAHPRVAPTALDEVARVYATAFASSALKSELAGRAKAALGDRLPPAAATAPDEARARAEAEARTREAEARARADAEKARVEAEGRARAEEAKRAAAEQAKNKLRGLLGR